MATLVMKFGGWLLADAERLNRVAQVISIESQAWERMVVVISAMTGVTDSLNQSIDLAAAGNASGYRRIIAGIRQQHLTTIEAIFTGSEQDELLCRDLAMQIDRLLFDVMELCDSVMARREAQPRYRDAAMSAGERMMSHIFAARLRRDGLKVALVDGPSVIVTDDRHQGANPLLDLTDERVDSALRPLLDAQIIPIVTGFIGGTRKGVITTLGRGGSDYTATLLAASLPADEVWIWAKVDGVMSADPAIYPGARVIPALSYEDISELSYFGAHILQLRSIEPLIAPKIPLRVRNLFNLEHGGTLIQAEIDDVFVKYRAVTAVDAVWLSSHAQSIDLTDVIGEVRRIAGQTLMGPVMTIQSQSRSTAVFVVPTTEGKTAVSSVMQRLVAGLGTDRWEIKPVKAIMAVGTPIADLRRLDGAFKLLASTTGPGDRQLLIVAPEGVMTAIRELHRRIISGGEPPHGY